MEVKRIVHQRILPRANSSSPGRTLPGWTRHLHRGRVFLLWNQGDTLVLRADMIAFEQGGDDRVPEETGQGDAELLQGPESGQDHREEQVSDFP